MMSMINDMYYMIPEQCMERIKQRSRSGEDAISRGNNDDDDVYYDDDNDDDGDDDEDDVDDDYDVDYFHDERDDGDDYDDGSDDGSSYHDYHYHNDHYHDDAVIDVILILCGNINIYDTFVSIDYLQAIDYYQRKWIGND